MTRFKNYHEKTTAILAVFKEGEWLMTDEISRRLGKAGWSSRHDPRHLAMFLRNYLLYRHLRQGKRDKKVVYSLISPGS